MTALAAAEVLEYHLERYRAINTFDAHRVAHLGASLGLAGAVNERLLRAQLVEGEMLEDADTLVRLGVEVGPPEADVRRVLAGDAFAAQVQADIDEARALGCTGVPFFVFDRRYGVSGARPSDLFLEVLQAVAAEAEALTPDAAEP